MPNCNFDARDDTINFLASECLGLPLQRRDLFLDLLVGSSHELPH
jgi:hypothetical protein